MTITPTEQRAPLEQQQHHAANLGRVQSGVFNPAQLWKSLPDALRKLNPRHQMKNPVMMVV
ncbi:MAG TPA: hypothetical protein VGL06_11710, partial [Pseudonocardiaceae bacterium]